MSGGWGGGGWGESWGGGSGSSAPPPPPIIPVTAATVAAVGIIVRRLDANGDVTYGQGLANYAAKAEGAAQRVRCRLRTFLGEWFLDTTAGVPWFSPGPNGGTQAIMGGPRNLQFAEAQIKACVLGTEGIDSIVSFAMAFNSSTRELAVSVTVISTDGDIINIREVSP